MQQKKRSEIVAAQPLVILPMPAAFVSAATKATGRQHHQPHADSGGVIYGPTIAGSSGAAVCRLDAVKIDESSLEYDICDRGIYFVR